MADPSAAASSDDRFAAVRAALREDGRLWRIEHCDITCDGCEVEPIIGHRYKCGVCEDIDLCGPCMRALVAARIKMAAEAGEVAAAAAPRRPPPGGRPRRWVSKLHSRDLAAKWAALQTAVPCLHPSHKFQRVVDGPERAVVYVAGSADGSADQLQPLQPQQATAADAADAAAEALAVASLGNGAAATSASSGGEPAAAAASSSSSSSGLDQFLATFPPSASSCADVAWICVEAQQQAAPASSSSGAGCAAAAAGSSSSGGGGAAAAGPSLEERVDAAVEEWERLTAAAARAKRRVTAADVDRLAAKHRILKGKWLCFARSPEEADGAWPAVARAVCGRPGGRPLCASAKCSSTAPDGSHVICAYVASYQDADDVQRVCCGLQQAVPPGLLQDRRLLFKPDIYTYLGIYSRNEWGLKPSIFEARLP